MLLPFKMLLKMSKSFQLFALLILSRFFRFMVDSSRCALDEYGMMTLLKEGQILILPHFIHIEVIPLYVYEN
jgi:hypothetical protein